MSEKIFTVDKFLGLNEAADSSTELAPGEASVMENFYITDGYNLRSRPGIVRSIMPSAAEQIVRAFPLSIGGNPCIVCFYKREYDGMQCARFYRDGKQLWDFSRGYVHKVFTLGGKAYVLWGDGGTEAIGNLWVSYLYSEGPDDLPEEYREEPYVPLVISGGAPTGGGTIVEQLNLLTPQFRAMYIADGSATEFVLPSVCSEVYTVNVGNESKYPPDLEDWGTFDAETHTFTFNEAPEEGVEVEFFCITYDRGHLDGRRRLMDMPYYEHFNGATDTRIFFYGDGTNLCYYTGIPAHGSGLYVPVMNELRVDFSDSPVTSLVRHYSRLLAFKPDGVDAITYEPITLADGSVIAGFFLQPVSRAYGNEAMAQLQLVNNNPRSLSGNSIYDWQLASGYRDERSAKSVSQKVSQTLRGNDLSKAVTCDDEVRKTYYVFLNDSDGTVLVHRYDLEAWSLYRSQLTAGVTCAFSFDGNVMILRGGELFTFDEEALYDDPVSLDGDPLPIYANWESGFLAFGADYKRKYSSRLWLSLLPQASSALDITVKTDKRSEYLTKSVCNSLLDFSRLDFSNFAFLMYSAPKLRRVQLKVKKFVYYKLILRVTRPGARATILGYDQQIRYSSNVK